MYVHGSQCLDEFIKLSNMAQEMLSQSEEGFMDVPLYCSSAYMCLTPENLCSLWMDLAISNKASIVYSLVAFSGLVVIVSKMAL